MLKRFLILAITALIVLSSVSAALASETEYAPTSVLNSGFKSGETLSTPAAWATFGSSAQSEGMRVEVGDDSSSVTMSKILGREGIVLDPSKGSRARYLNIDLDSDVGYDVTDGQSYAVEIDYYDDGISSLALEYDAMDYQPLWQKEAVAETSQPALNTSAKIKECEYLVFNDTKVWRTYRWFLPNPKFTGKVDGFDLRVGIYGETMQYSRGGEVIISQIRIYKLDTKSRIDITGNTEKHIGNIFFTGDEIELTTDFSSCIYPYYNQLDGAYPLDVRYTATDEDGRVVWQGSESFTLDALSTVSRTQKFKVDKYGIYRFDTEAFCPEKNIYSRFGTEFSYVRSDKGKTVNPKCGVQIALSNPEDTKIAELTRFAGIPNVRLMLYYHNFRKSATNYEVTNTATPESFKSLLRAFKNSGLEIDANLHSASWMGAQYNFSPIERTPPYTENGLRRWADYCTMMAELFGDTVDQFEIWNEYNLGPNHSFNMENRPAEDYGKMYEVSKKAIQAVNPDIPVLAFNTSGAAPAWIEQVLASGVTDVDIISIHPYQWYGDPITYSALELGIKPLYEVLKKYNLSDVPVWITEYGYSSHYESVNTDLEQGLYTVQAYADIMASSLIDRYYIYCMLNLPANLRAERENNFGLIRDRINYPVPYMTPYAAKPAYLMVSQMNMMYADAEPAGQIDLGSSGRIIRNKHTKDGKDFAVMFSNKEGGELVTLNLGADRITVYDAYGNAEEVCGADGVYSFDLSKRLIYIEGNFTKFERVTGGVYPAKTEITKLYGHDAQIPVLNYSGKKIYAKAEPLEGSSLKGSETEISGEGGFVTLSGGAALGSTERVRLTLTDGEKTYFSGFVYVKFTENAQLHTTLVPTADGWKIRSALTNLSDSESVTGRLTLLTPREWKDSVPDTAVTLKPGETVNVDLKLPVPAVSDERVIEMGFVTDEATAIGSYIRKNYNFSAAQYASSPIVIDADGSEWTEGFMSLNRSDQFTSLINLGSVYGGPEDLSAKAAVKWDEDNFYFYADVLDNVHFSKGVEPVNIWQMDSIQLALVYDPYSELVKSAFEELAISDLDGTPTLYRHKTRFTGEGDYTKIKGAELAIKNIGEHTYYELKIPWAELMPDRVDIKPGTQLKFAMVINENDGVGRTGYMSFGDGIVSSKNSSLFKQLYIRDKE